MKKTIFAAIILISSHAFAAEPTIFEVDKSAAQIMEAANLAVKASGKRILGNTMTFQAKVPIEIDLGKYTMNTYTDMIVDMTIVAKDGKYKVESSNPQLVGENGTGCGPRFLRVDFTPFCEKGMVGMQAHVGNNILRQLAKSDF